MLQLCPDGQIQTIRYQGHLVLKEAVEHLKYTARRIERDRQAAANMIRRKVVTSSPNNVVAFAESDVVLVIDIERVPRFRLQRIIARVAIERDFECRIGPL